MISPAVRRSRAQQIDCLIDQQPHRAVEFIEHALEAAVLAEREACAKLAEAEAVGQAEKMAAAHERSDVKTADMLEAQVVTASKIQGYIRARGAGDSPARQEPTP